MRKKFTYRRLATGFLATRKFVLTLLSIGFTFMVSGEANYVYHEPTINAIGCGAFQYRSVLTPNSSQALTIGFKIEFQGYWNQARIYYTTDGSNPSGAFGVGSGTTQVVVASYQCGFGTPNVSEVVTGVIPAQPAGTVVKYIVSAWHSGGGNEIFANGPGTPCGGCGTITNSSALATVFTYTVAVGPVRVTSTAGTGAPTTYYASIAAAITAINGGTAHTGTINCYVDAGYTETAPAGGYQITANGTAANPIIFQRSGVGANPLITAGAQVAGSYSDGIFKIIGGDYITISGFTLQENSANTVTTIGATNTMTEFGIGLFPTATGTTDGAQNNTIQNNTISLNATYGQSMGIFSTSRAKAAAITTVSDATSTAGTNSNNKFYGNNISNVALGMYFISPGTTATIMEVNDIGGTSLSTGNTISFGSASAPGTNIASTSATYSAGIMFRSGVGSSVRYNTITSNSVAYTNVSGGVLGVYYYGGGTAPAGTYTSTCSNNTITLTNTGATPITAIDFGSGASTGAIVASNNTISITQPSTAAVSGAIYGIRASYTSSTKTLDANTISITQSNSTAASSGNVYGINVGTNAGTTVNITNNPITIKQSVSGAGSFTGPVYYVNADASSTTVNITGNTFNTTGGVLRTTGTKYLVNMGAASIGTALSISNNNASIDASAATAGDIYGTYSSGSSGISNYNINSNNFSIASASSGWTVGFYNLDGGSPTKTLNSNQVTVTGSGTNIYGFYLGWGTINAGTNTINIATSAQTPSVIGITTASGGTLFNISGNIISNITASATGTSAPSITGIKSGHGTNNIISGNTIKDISTGASTGNANIAGIEITGGTSPTIYGNNLYNISASVSGNTSLMSGISFQSTPTGPFTVYNNFLSDFRMPNAPTTGGIFVINGARTGYTYRIYYNTIKLGSTASPLSGQTNLRIVAAGFLSTSANEVDLRNNIININSNAISSGFASCIALTGVTAVAGTVAPAFASTNNSNIYSINAASSNFIYAEGSTFATLKNGYALSGLTANATNNIVNDPSFNTGCGLYKLFMGGSRENASFTEDNLVAGGTTGTFLPSGASYAENGAQAISTPSITTDFAAVSRTPTNDIGALQFSGTAVDGVAPVITYTANPSGNVMCVQTVTATITDAASGVNTSSGTKPRLYFKKSTEANAFGNYPTDNTSAFNGWKYVEASNSSSPFSFTFNFSLLNSAIADGDIISYFIAAQDLATTPNIGLNSAVINGGCPVSVNFGTGFSTASTVNSFTYKTIPSSLSLAASASNICVSGTSTISINTTPSLSNVTYLWEESTASGGPFVSASGTNTSASYTTPTLTSAMYYRVRVYCSGVEIAASPSAAIAISVSNPNLTGTTPAGRCATGTVVLGATGTGGTLTWYSSLTGGTALGTGTSYTTPSISASTTYYVGVENISSGSTSVGAGASTTVSSGSSSDNISPFDHYFGGKKSQYLIRASELTAQNLTAGNITALTFDVGSGGVLYAGFNLSIGATASTALTTTFVTGLTPVYTSTAPAGLTTPSSGLVTINFSTPYNWDGTSNIVIQTCWSNNNSGGTGTTVKYDATAYAASSYYRADAVVPATLCANTSATTLNFRPKIIFSGQVLCSTARTAVTATVSAQPSALTITPASVSSLCSGSIQPLAATGGDVAGLSIFSEGFETFPTANFAANGAGVTPVTSTYYSEGTKSVRLGHSNSLTTSSTTNSYVLQNNINLSTYSAAQLSFSHICALEGSGTTYDAGYIQYSTNGGTSWTTFPSSSYAGSGTLMTTVNAVAVTGAIFSTKSYADWTSTFTGTGSTPGAAPATALWKTEILNIPAAALSSTQFRVRFMITADASSSYWGWQIDDVKITGTGQAAITWTPVTDLYTNAGATSSYSLGTNWANVYSKPTADVTYTATATNGFCTSTKTVAITVKPTGQWVGPATGGDWNVASNWCGGVPTASTNVIIPDWAVVDIKSANAVANSVTVQAPTTASGINMTGAYNLTITAGGYINNGGAFTATGSTGAVVFAGAGTVTGTMAFQNVTINGAVSFSNASSVNANGSLQINSGGSVNTNSLTYDCTSTLLYNTGGTYGRFMEWTNASSGKGYPGNVTLQNNTTLNYPNGDASARSMCGVLTIGAGSSFYMDYGTPDPTGALTIGKDIVINGNLSLSDAAGGDIKVGGNWSRAASGSAFTPKSRAVYFNAASGNQTISRTGGEIFDYLVVEKTSGNLVLNDNVSTNASSGNVLQLLGGNIDLNGKSFSMNNAGGNILASGAVRTIVGTNSAANFYINGYKTVTSASSGTLVFDNNVTVQANAAINFGAMLSTVNGVLQLNSGSYVDINAPYYGNASLLKYNTTGFYDRRVEWSGNAVTDPGYPNDVLVTNNTTLQPGGAGGSFVSTAFNALRDVSIDAGSAIYMDATAKLMLVPLRTGRDLTIAGSLSASTTVGGDVYVGRNWLRTGTFTHNNRAVFFNSGQNSTITATGGQSFAYLYIDKNALANTVASMDDITITRELGITRGTYRLDVKNTTFRSDATYTARFGRLDANGFIDYNGAGRFKVERYISHRRRWQLLSVPALSTQTIREAWQDNGSTMVAPATGYGVQITGPGYNGGGNGLDALSTLPSMKYQVGTSADYTAVTATNGSNLISNKKGFFLYAYGDRSAGPGTAAGPATTLATTGKLFEGRAGSQQAPDVFENATAEGEFMSVGNPFASPVNFEDIYNLAGTNNIKPNFYVWDPSQDGAEGYASGTYQTIAGVTGNIVTPGGGTIYTPSNSDFSDIQSGQAFFVESDAAGEMRVAFNESVKSSPYRLANRGANSARNPADIAMLSTFVYTRNNAKMIDGCRIVAENYADAIDKNDAGKMWNEGANFGTIRNGYSMSVEARSRFQLTDTVHYEMYYINPGSYQMVFAVQNLQTGNLLAELVDRYTGTRQPVSLTDSSFINFDIDNNSGSAAADRFYLVFKRAPVAPFRFVDVKVQRNADLSAQVSWKVTNEQNIIRYELERSAINTGFNRILQTTANGSSQYSKPDTNPLSADNYYRIKATGSNGEQAYSPVVKLEAAELHPLLTVYPNPIRGKQMNLRLTGLKEGSYRLLMHDRLGKLVMEEKISVTGCILSKTISLPQTMAGGNYQLSIFGANGSIVAGKAVIVE